MKTTKSDFGIKCNNIITTRAKTLNLNSSVSFTIYDNQYICDYVLYNFSKMESIIVGEIEMYNDKLSQKEMVINPELIEIIKSLK